MPKLAEGVEFIGQYEDSGFKDPPYLIQKGDGQVVQVTELLYHVAKEIDGERDPEEIAAAASAETDTALTAENVEVLVERKLRPLGVLENKDGTQPESARISPLLALNFRAALIPERVVKTLANMFKPLFLGPLVVAVVVAFVALEVWLFGFHGVAESFRQSLEQPVVMLFALGMVIVSAAFHEIGHAAACAYSGAEPGVMGAGVYLVWPAFYTDVTDAYRLDRAGRLRTDLGGLYFNAIFSVALAGVYFGTGFEPLLAIIVVQNLEMVHQLLPVVRLDGYYVIADLVGVPDLFARIKPILKSMLPWRRTEEGARELKSWARVAVTVWVLVTIPALIFFFVMMAIGFPRIAATAWESFMNQYGMAAGAFGDGQIGQGALAVLQIIALILPVLAMTVALGRAVWNLGKVAWIRSGEVRYGQPALGSVMAVALAALVFIWWPSGDYQPIQQGERWTVGETVQAARAIPSGSPGVAYQESSTEPAQDEQERSSTSGPADTSSTSTTQPATTTTTAPATTTTTGATSTSEATP